MKEYIRFCEKDFEIRKNTRRKRIAVGVDSHGTWFVGAPDFFSKEQLIKILAENENASKLIGRIEAKICEIPPKRAWNESEELLFRGKFFPLRWTEAPAAPPLELRDEAFYISSRRRGKEIETFELWYERQLYRILREILPVWTQRLSAAPIKVSVKTVKTFWGSCSAKNRITFSSRLALTPTELLEYVVVHELAHLKYMNHSDKFWQEIARHIPDYKERRANLRKNGASYKWW